MSNKLVVILGPTAAGKTALAIKLTKKLALYRNKVSGAGFVGEIVAADSRQIYSEMAIGTASPFQNQRLRGSDPSNLYGGLTPMLLQGVKHHLFGIIRPQKLFSVAGYQKLAIKTIKDIQKRGKLPFLVGGSPFYIYSVVEGWQFPKTTVNLSLRKKLDRKSAKELFALLKRVDPTRSKTIEQKNKRRLIRAIEIARQLSRVPKLKKNPLFDCLILGVNVAKEELKKRISKRVDEMLKSGLEKEVKNLIKKYGFNAVLKGTIGYQEWLPYFEKKTSIKQVAEQIKLHTFQFVNRQMAWFKRDKRIIWLKNQKQAENLIKSFTTF